LACWNRRSECHEPVQLSRSVVERELTLWFDSFWVCEKSDGVRVLVLILSSPQFGQEVYLVRLAPVPFARQAATVQASS